MKKAIEEFVLTGECKINRSVAIKKWTLLCRIIKHKEDYVLVECTPKGKTKLRVSIGKEDADYLIQELHLKYVPHNIFKNSGTFLNV